MIKIDTIIRKVKSYDKDADTALIRKAHETAVKAHKGEKRASGESYIVHPLEVANLAADFKMDTESVCAALLHDVIENAEYPLKFIEKEFGKDVAMIVDGLTKLTQLKSKGREEYQFESIRKMLFATAKDIRILIIKLLDKLHNMRTLNYLPREKQLRIAKEVMGIYTPLAYRLGIHRVKSQLEDLAFRYTQPERYSEINSKVKSRIKEREKEISKLKKQLNSLLKENSIPSEIIGRLKTAYAIYRKMKRKNRSFEEIFDVVGVRIITDSVANCYKILGLLHNTWKPIPRRFKDYIAMPKVNMYQSLHDVMLTPEGRVVEVQIRTREMEEVAEEGIAAHWQYKGLGKGTEFDKKLSWLKEIIDWQQESDTAKEFIESLEIDFFKDEIYTFTPRGDVIELPNGSTPLDFAYSVHSEIGNHCMGAKVNGMFVSLRYPLKTGDVVEVITSKTQRPSRSWLNIAKTTKALHKIKKAVQEKEKLPAKAMKKKEKEDLGDKATGILVCEAVSKPKFKLASCCTPNPGDKIIGLTSKTDTVTVHRKDCKAYEKAAKKKVKVEWRQHFDDVITLKIEALDRPGLFADILNTITFTGASIQNANAKVIGNNMAECSFKLNLEDLEHIKEMIERIRRLQGVKKIFMGSVGL